MFLVVVVNNFISSFVMVFFQHLFSQHNFLFFHQNFLFFLVPISYFSSIVQLFSILKLIKWKITLFIFQKVVFGFVNFSFNFTTNLDPFLIFFTIIIVMITLCSFGNDIQLIQEDVFNTIVSFKETIKWFILNFLIWTYIIWGKNLFTFL